MHGCMSWKAVLSLLGWAGEHFVAVFGSNQSTLESVLLKRRVMMPCWLPLKHPTRIDTPSQVSTFLHVLVATLSIFLVVSSYRTSHSSLKFGLASVDGVLACSN
jgi:hypothetical protein